jgi:hypothetical protein
MMKSFKLIPKDYLKLLLELVVIFFSVVLAFFFDDYRESRNVRAQYVADLLTFRDELSQEINNIAVKLDTFLVKDDLSYRGARINRLTNMAWFDWQISNRKASMKDLEFLLRSGCLLPETGGYTANPLASEIRIKYTEQIQSKNLTKYLRIYDEEMKVLSQSDEELLMSHKDLQEVIQKMNPFLRFTRQDSIFNVLE